jgi:hypothetical protein
MAAGVESSQPHLTKESKMELPFTVNGIKAYYAESDAFDTGKIPENQAYVLDADGWNLYLRNHISESLNNIPKGIESGMVRLKAVCTLRLEKIPYSLIRKVGKFFTEIHKLYKSEAVGYLYYAPQRGWQFYPPEQTATTAHCKYGEPMAIEGYRVAGTIHSHGAMSAFHSGTDEADEANFDGIHITIGKVDEVRYDLALSVVCGGVRYKCTEEQLISGFGETTVPTEWMNAVKQPSATPHYPGAATFTRVTDTRAGGGYRAGHWDREQNKWIEADPSGGNTNPLSTTANYQHVYTDEEWAKLSKAQKKEIKKRQKQQDAEGSGLLSFLDARRFGGLGW